MNPIRRWANGLGYKNCVYFFNAVLKYGWDNIKHEILYTGLTQKEAEYKEIELIKIYRSNDPDFGYNIQLGGYRNNNGIKRTPEQIQHYIEGARKRPKREHLSEEHKKNISKSLIGNKRAAGLTCNRKAVLQYSLDGKLLATYYHAAEAAEIIKCNKSGINRACRENNEEDLKNTKYKGVYKGFRWKYIKTHTEKWADKLAGLK
jgi:hypothetical protein